MKSVYTIKNAMIETILILILPTEIKITQFTNGFCLKGAVSRQSSSFCLIFPITRPQSLWNLK